MKLASELTQLLGAIIAIVGAGIINTGLALMLFGIIMAAIGTLAERSMSDGSGSNTPPEE